MKIFARGRKICVFKPVLVGETKEEEAVAIHHYCQRKKVGSVEVAEEKSAEVVGERR